MTAGRVEGQEDASDAHVLADMARTHAHELRPSLGQRRGRGGQSTGPHPQDDDLGSHSSHPAAAARATALLPPAFVRFEASTPPTPWNCSARTTPAQASRDALQISAALNARADIAEKAGVIQAALPASTRPAESWRTPTPPRSGAARGPERARRSVKTLPGRVEAHFRQHPAAEIIGSQPGLGPVLGARVLAEFGDDPTVTTAPGHKNYAGTSPITGASARRRSPWPGSSTTTGSSTHLMSQAFGALKPRPARGPTTTGDAPRRRHNAALRQLANRLVESSTAASKPTLYDETTAWSHHVTSSAA